MRTIRTKVYQFSELSKEAQTVAIEQMQDINTSHDWWKNVYEDAKNIGLEIQDFDLYRNEIGGKLIWDEAEAANEILENHGEMCATWQTAENFLTEFNPLYKELFERDEPNATDEDLQKDEEIENKLEHLKEKFLKNLLSNYKKMLQDELDYRESQEAIIETIEANEYEFLQNGEQF